MGGISGKLTFDYFNNTKIIDYRVFMFILHLGFYKQLSGKRFGQKDYYLQNK